MSDIEGRGDQVLTGFVVLNSGVGIFMFALVCVGLKFTRQIQITRRFLDYGVCVLNGFRDRLSRLPKRLLVAGRG